MTANNRSQPSVPTHIQCKHCGCTAKIEMDMVVFLSQDLGNGLSKRVGMRFPYRCACGRKPFKDRDGVSRIERFASGRVFLA